MMIYFAALDSDGVIASIVSADDAWWATAKTDAATRLDARGFALYMLDSVGPIEIERHLTGWGDFDGWLATLQPA